MMRIFILLILINLSLSLSARDTLSSKDLLIQIGIGTEQHDKRLFNYSERENLTKLHPEYFGSYTIDILVAKSSFVSKRINNLIGFNYRHHTSSFTRPFDHGKFNQDDFRILRNLNHYQNIRLGLLYLIDFEVNHNYGIRIKNSFRFNIYTKADFIGIESTYYPYTMVNFNFNSFEIEPEFYINIGKMSIGLESRLLSIGTIDSIIFGSWIKDDHSDKNIDFNNPIKLALSLGYSF